MLLLNDAEIIPKEVPGWCNLVVLRSADVRRTTYDVRRTTGDVRCTTSIYNVLRLWELRGSYNIMDWHCSDLVSTIYGWPIQLRQHATMYNVRSTLYDARCTTGDVWCTMYDVQCVLRLGKFRGLCNVMDWHCLSLVSIVWGWPFQHWNSESSGDNATLYDVRRPMYDIRCPMYNI